ncbi:MAG: T9SS C-terminal target domain-containing protein [Cytophagales bacterium]|nr:MAG: T9SS C-terminal target domain-containing protein [Cytophagales bacterium]
MFKKFLTLGTTAFMLYAGSTQAQMSLSGQYLTKQGSILASAFPGKLILADFNNDGRKDILSPNGSGNSIYVITSSGLGTFASSYTTYSSSSTSPQNASSVAVGDLNNDGRLDFVATNPSRRVVKAFLNTASAVGTFFDDGEYGNGENGAYDVALGDINNDGNLDIAYVTQFNATTGNLVVLTGTGTGKFTTYSTYTLTSQAFCVGVADLNKDGYDDVVVTDKNANYLVFTSTGISGKLGNYYSFNANGARSKFKLVDVNNDGNLDLVNAYRTAVSVQLGNGDGTFTNKGSYPTPGGSLVATNIDVADIDLDGKVDLIASAGYGFCVLKGFEDGTFTNFDFSNPTTSNYFNKDILGNDSPSGNIAAVDIDADGKIDVIETYSSSPNYGAVWKNISLKSQTITGFGSSNTVVYGGTLTGFTAAATSGLTISYSSSNGNIATVIGANLSILRAGIVTITANQIGDNTYSPAEPMYMTVTITKANLTITADNFSKVYGTKNPNLTGTTLGLVSGDESAISYSTLATSMSGVGIYIINPLFNGSKANNYNTTLIAGALTITQANLTITSDSFSKVYGTENPMFTGSTLGMVNNDVITPSFSTSATSTTGIGSYAIMATATGANINNYELLITNSTLTITQANLTVSAGNLLVATDANIVYVSTVTGLLGMDEVTVVYTLSKPFSTTAGTYMIIPSVTGMAAPNYSVTVSEGTLITKYKQILTGFDFGTNATMTGKSLNATVTVASGLTVNYFTSNASVIEYLSGALRRRGQGTAIVYASVDAFGDYFASNTVSGIVYVPSLSLTGMVLTGTGVLTLSGMSPYINWMGQELDVATSYCVRLSTEATFTNGSTVTICGINDNQFMINVTAPGLSTLPTKRTEADGDIWFYQVAGVDNNGVYSQWSNSQSFATRIESTTNLNSELLINNYEFSIVPNPSTGTFKVSGGKSVTVFDLLGKVILSTFETSFTISSKGLFIAQVETANGIKFVKLVVE